MFWAFEGPVSKIQNPDGHRQNRGHPQIVIFACVLHHIYVAEDDIERFLNGDDDDDDDDDDDGDDDDDIFSLGIGTSDKRNKIMRLLRSSSLRPGFEGCSEIMNDPLYLRFVCLEQDEIFPEY